MSLVGHEKALQSALQLLKPIRRRALAVIAPEGVGRQYFSMQLFLAVNENLGLNIYSEDLKVFNKDFVSVEDIRDLNVWVSLKPIKAHTKFLILPGSKISESAQQALLKLLEEPPSHLVIILYVASLKELLPATRSRLSPINLFTLSHEECEKVWHNLGVDDSVYQTLWKLAPGHPGLALHRNTKKYESNFNSFAAFLKTKTKSAITFLHWQAQLPADWTPKDHTDFWLWVIPKLFQAKKLPTSKEAIFCKRVSETILENPGIDTTFLLPALWFEVFEN